MRKLSWFFLLLIIGCSPEVPQSDSGVVYSAKIDTNTNQESTIDSITKKNSQRKKLDSNDKFLNFFTAFTNAIKVKGSLSLFIHQNYGFYAIEATGAMPQIKHIYNNDQFWFLPELKLFQSQSLDSLTKTPLFEGLPKVICDTTIYDKQGCFASEENPLQKSRPWNYASLNEKEIQAIEFLAETVSMTVVNTSNFTFYFSKIEGNWYLTFLDLRTPCQA